MAARKFQRGQKPGQTDITKNAFKGRQSRKGSLHNVGPELQLPPRKDQERVPSGNPPKKHPLALSGGRHPPERKEKPKFTQDAPVKPSEASGQAKAPASGTMSHTPESPSQRGSVATGGDKASQQIISGTEAVNRAGDEAARRKMERELWGIGVGGGN